MLALAVVAVAVVAAAVAFFVFYRPWQLRWGATAEELARPMPGDEIVRHPIFNATRVITVNARPEDIWPWIVQIGFHRAGFYTYDLLDNFGRRSAKRIVPELQHMDVGDLVPFGPGKIAGIWVKEVVPNRSLVWWGKKDETTTWVWSLDPLPDGKTRLVTRVRAPVFLSQPLTIVSLLMFEFADFPMMRKCMLGIKRRAEMRPAEFERLPAVPTVPTGSRSS
jgi:hypothetical protein